MSTVGISACLSPGTALELMGARCAIVELGRLCNLLLGLVDRSRALHVISAQPAVASLQKV